MKLLSIFAVIVIGAVLALCLLQLWFALLPVDIFVKVLITLGMLLAGVTVIGLICREYLSEQKMKRDKYLD